METREYTHNSTEDFLALVQTKYEKQKNFDYFFNDLKTALHFCIESENVTFLPIGLYDGDRMIGHIALVRDTRLKPGEAFFGFLESPQNIEAFTALWNALTNIARREGISSLKGPVNGSIWHQYRCIKEGDESAPFKSEPISERYYYDFLSLQKPNAEMQYMSAYRKHFNATLRLLKIASLSKLFFSHYSVRTAKNITPSELASISHISKETFKNSWGYTELTKSEFLQLYSTNKLAAHLNNIYLLYKDDTLIGFLSTGKEDDQTLICKTIAITPAFQKRGLGNLLAYEVHADAKKQGITKIIYALVRDGNRVKNFPKKDLVIFRKYAVFEFTI